MPDHLNTSTPKKERRRKGQHSTAAQRIDEQNAFLKAFASSGNVRAACMAAGINRSAVYSWSETDVEFTIRYNQAKSDVDDAIRAEIYRRGMFGEERYVIAQGKIVYHEGKPLTIREKSDTLLIFHAKARMPEYKDKQHIDMTTTTSAKDVQSLQDTIAQALSPYPDAKIAVAAALVEMEKERGH